MDGKELTSQVNALTKAASKNDFDTMKTIMEGFLKETPSEDLLRSTRAGVVVGKLRSKSNKDIARLAGEIVSKWRKGVEVAKTAKAKRLRATSGGTLSKLVPGQPLGPPPPPPSTKAYMGDPNARHFKKDQVNINKTPSSTRNNMIGLMYSGLAYRSRESVAACLARAIEIEKAAFEAYKGETPGYCSKMRSLYMNLKNKKNRQLGINLMSGNITSQRFVVMTDQELQSAEQRAVDEEIARDNMKKAQVPQAERSISDALKCGKCGQKKVSYSQAQTRSADEPMTTFCECINCGNRWKFS